ncbi:hypothetical protein A3C86_03805 [Candidatus Kaiserbacteria bacterium RIFCSPHIGHO2_02_FULL_49_16]|uniref:Growth inhibitor PemK n=1 Tax=Candidatus Kaiserbacteria bacterium RIFCSPHIGHO2_02_FULL_49_16 TaxID=1798490 RepID=A0A1F6DA73_9BACT|nr:MAG: hypothetical protein A3C86_03805 [Candidatus Kaiserbacteria bacterium RIFCSPHIGHO2_02_FULL_49_16]
MPKDFDTWNTEKKHLDSIGELDFPHPKRRQVWWCSVGENIGSEQGVSEGFERPVLVLKVFGSMFWGIPITSSDPEGKKATNPLYFNLGGISYTNQNGEEKTLVGFIATHQMRSYDGRRLKRKLFKMDLELFNTILQIVRGHI